MKKVITSCIISVLFISQAFSQACIPNWTEPGSGIYPDTLTDLAPGMPNVPYDFTVQFKVPLVDSSIISTGISVDHVELTGVTGLDLIPASTAFHYNCNPTSCSFKADSVGCVRIQGTPTTEGSYPLTINAKVYISPVVFLPVNFSGYHITISSTIGIPNLSQSKFDVSQNLPNPVHSKAQVFVNLPKAGAIEFKVSNVIGNQVFKTTIPGHQGLNSIAFDATSYAPGIYFYTVTSGNNSITKRMVVEKK